MHAAFIFLGVCISTAVIAFLIVSLVGWTSHRWQVRVFCKIFGKANYRQFRREFDKRRWSNKAGGFVWSGSLFEEGNSGKSELHANLIQFDNVGMVLDYVSWIRARWHVCRYLKRFRKQYTYDWNSDNE